MISMSPAVRRGVIPLPLHPVPGQEFLLNSKSILVVPLGSWTRLQNRFRNPDVVEPSWYTPKAFRSLLFGGMLPSTTVGTVVLSLVPCPNESSPEPEGLSGLRVS